MKNPFIPEPLNRKLKLMVSLATVCCNAVPAFSQTQPALAKQPNFVIILTDDMGYGDAGAFGATDVRTPNIDSLAQNGIKLTSFYSTSPVCSPSRAGLLTGRYPRRAGIDHVFFPESFTGLPKEEVTLAEALKTKGYINGIVGKWHLGHHQQFLPLQNGFDEYYGIPYSNDMSGVAYLKGNLPDSLKIDQHYITRTYTSKAVNFINRNKGKPFFLYLAHNMPHVPLYASPAFEGKSKRGLYGDAIEEIDWSVGQVIKALKKNGIENSTLVIFTSDNGPWTVFDIEGGSAGPLRSGKGTTFEGGQRVPGIAYWPGKIKPGSVYDGITLQLDIFPTLLNLANVPNSVAVNRIDGEDISQVLFGLGVRKGNEFAYFNNGRIESFRKGDWKIHLPSKELAFQGIVLTESSDSILINLKNDIGEKNNLLTSEPAIKADLLRSLETYKKKFDNSPAPLTQRMPADESHIQKFLQRHPELKKSLDSK
jgi:arylsulfatase A